jgi:hypothetical protein
VDDVVIGFDSMVAVYRLWMFGLTSPVIYLLIAVAVNRLVFDKRTVPGFWPLSADMYRWVLAGLAVISIAAVPAVLYLKKNWADKVATDAEGEAGTILDSARGRRFVAIFIICDTVAMFGLILFLVQGRFNAVLVFGVIALLNYAAAYPGPPKHEST